MATHPDSTTNPKPQTGDVAPGSQAAEKAQAAIDRTAQSAHAMVDRAAEKVTPAVEHLHSSVSSASAALHSGVEEFDAYQERWLANCRGQVRDNPLLSLAIAVLAGMLIGRLLSR